MHRGQIEVCLPDCQNFQICTLSKFSGTIKEYSNISGGSINEKLVLESNLTFIIKQNMNMLSNNSSLISSRKDITGTQEKEV